MFTMIGCKTRSVPQRSRQKCVDAFSVEHTSALDRAVVDITLSRFPALAALTAWGAGLTALDRIVAENLRSRPREGPRQGQRA
jgi:hypothetical protein